MQRAPGINNNRSLKDNLTIYQLVSVSIRSCTWYEHFLRIRFKLISPYFYLHSNVKIDLTIIFISRWKRETNSDHSILDSNSLTVIHLDMVGIMYIQEHL